MDEVDFFKAWFDISDLREIVKCSKSLRRPAVIYCRNMESVHDSLLAIPFFVGSAARDVAAVTWATSEVNDVINALQPYNLTNDEIHDFVERRTFTHLSHERVLDMESGNASERFYQKAAPLMVWALRRYQKQFLRNGLNATLRSAIIHASAAMEVCLGQVWHAAYSKSKLLQAESGDKLRIFYEAQSRRGVPMTPPKNGPAKSFTSLQNARGQYARAFSQDYTGIDAAMSSFDLDAVALVRNLILHKHGVPDVMFKGQAKGIPILKSAISTSPPKAIEIHGELVAELISLSLAAVRRVVKAVDQWLVMHP